jgi:hypothetical protein
MRLTSFRYCMLIGALALAGLAVFYFFNYVVLSIALNNNGMQLGLKDYIRAMWLAYACQSLLIGALYALVAWKPHAVSREVIVLMGLLQLVEAVLMFTFSGSGVATILLIGTSVFVLIGAALWPKRLPSAANGSSDSGVSQTADRP